MGTVFGYGYNLLVSSQGLKSDLYLSPYLSICSIISSVPVISYNYVSQALLGF